PGSVCYNAPGSFRAMQIAFNTCGSDTSFKNINVIGLPTFSSATFQKAIGGAPPKREEIYSVRQTKDDGFILAGLYDSGGSYDALAIKTDAFGNIQWAKTYGASPVSNKETF